MSARRELAALLLVTAGCTGAPRDGVSASYLIVDSLEAASGAEPATFNGTLASDVVTVVNRQQGGAEVQQPTVFEDFARVSLSLALKDPGSPTSPAQPTTTNFITVTRYRVRFIRADGRNVPGVDVPYPFDGAFTLTVSGEGQTMTFTLVRSQAKREAPLAALAAGTGVISTLAEVTFYGSDQAGRVVKAVALIGVNFANWSDPET
jgi:hypothetical protein